MNHRLTLAATAVLAATLASPAANALVITTTNDVSTLQAAVLAPSSGISVVGNSLVSGAATQQATYTGFNLAPSSGSTATLSLGDGILLTSGNANLPLTNTTNQFTGGLNSPGFPALSTLAGANTFDANVLSFTFTIAGGQNAVSASFLFGSEEFPTQNVTDIFGFFVDGVNYAFFPGGALIANAPGSGANFINNPVGGGIYGIEYNGLTPVFSVTGLLDMSLTTHTLSIAIADTNDTSYDSGVFFTGLSASNSSSGGGIGDPGTPVPEPASLTLLGMGMLGLAAMRRRIS